MRSLPLRLLGLVLLLAPIAATGTDWYVPSPECPTIQAGIDLADSGDRVLVAPGTYHDCTHPDIDGRLNCVIMKSGVTLRSENGDPNSVTIDAQSLGRVIFCWGLDSSTSIEAITVTGGHVPDVPYSTMHGGGIYIRSSDVNIVNCNISSNWSERGGGAYVQDVTATTAPVFRHCLISENTATTGGGVFWEGCPGMIDSCTVSLNEAGDGGGIYTWTSDLQINECTISGNRADETRSAGDGGGIICTQGSSPLITGTTVSDNWADGSGGGIYVDVFSSLTIMGCTITAGFAGFAGGGILVSDNSSASILDSKISYNRASYGGGGVRCWQDSFAEVKRCLIIRNTSENGSGGGLCTSQNSPVEIGGCTFSDNRALDYGGGIACFGSDSPADVDSTIIAFSLDGGAVYCDTPGDVQLICCDVYQNTGGDWVGCIAGQDGDPTNLCADPKFCNQGGDNYYLMPDSPCAPNNSPSDCGLIGALNVIRNCPGVWVRDADGALPGALLLGAAAPNPFNLLTRFRYGVPAHAEASHVTLKVYDCAGRLVRVLVDAKKPAGIHVACWDATDRKGARVSSGVYFYRITWNGMSETKRMVLLK